MEIRRSVETLAWDDWNISHIAERHGISQEDVEAVIRGNAIAEKTYKNKILVIGPDADGRLLAVIIREVPKSPGVFYPFSARVASRKERRRYDASQKSG